MVVIITISYKIKAKSTKEYSFRMEHIPYVLYGSVHAQVYSYMSNYKSSQ